MIDPVEVPAAAVLYVVLPVLFVGAESDRVDIFVVEVDVEFSARRH